MASIAKLSLLSSPLTTFKTSFLPKSPSSLSHTIASPKKSTTLGLKVHAQLGGRDEETKTGDKKKFITREQEPEQYWQTAGEREGENPMKTPLPYIIIFGMSTPFVILAIAFANGWIKVPIR
ncbi:hypothetical protein P8452_49810 [Trifolium repens]|jgi:hypothetical protein|nr:hypothetical protein QL285_078882 [Trifolium repens]WJX65113.1 hypothetical protein P8452_49810 [Trifolium repens]